MTRSPAVEPVAQPPERRTWPSLDGKRTRGLHVRSTDGRTLAVDVFGEGTPTLFLQNGLFCSIDYFVPLIDHFARRYRVVTWDYPSHGRSDDIEDASALGIARLADDACCVLDSIGGGPFVVVGHSMGVRVGLELNRRRSDRIAAMVLLCGSVDQALGTGLGPLSGVASRLLGAGLAIRGTSDRLRQIAARTRIVPELAYLFGGMCRERTPHEPVDALLRNLGRMNIDAVIHLARSYIAHSGRPLLADLRAPTLIVGGERDGLAPPEHCLGVARELADAEVWIAPGCTHLALVEDPAGVNTKIDRFLERLERG